MGKNKKHWLSISEIRSFFGVSNHMVYQWIDKHGMPAHRKGGLWKFRIDEVDDWVKGGGADRLRRYGVE